MASSTGDVTSPTPARAVAPGEVQGPDSAQVKAMFGEIAPRYDLANQVLSGGVHHLWRNRVVRWSGAKKGDAVLDCATGTGDLAIAFAKVVGDEGRVVGTDFSPQMLAPAPEKAARAGVKAEFAEADVTQLAYQDDEFDVSSISFGIRNVQDPGQGIAELGRVTRSGGVVMVLEFGQPVIPGFRGVYNLYSRVLLPRIGGLITGQGSAYRYLQDSSAQFPCRRDFVELMMKTGRFSSVEFRSLTGGIAYMYRGVVA